MVGWSKRVYSLVLKSFTSVENVLLLDDVLVNSFLKEVKGFFFVLGHFLQCLVMEGGRFVEVIRGCEI